MRRLKWFLLAAVLLGVAALIVGWVTIRQSHGFSARAQPTGIERWMARLARAAAMPADAKERANPVPNTPEAIADGRAHWADHCATCHANDGSGNTEIGKHLYPPAPDMRLADTQQLTDGELFYIIENGVRLSGMPAWGGEADHGQDDSWKLVRFIRHLPNLSPSEIKEMEALNPKTSEDREQERKEEQFLKGEPPKESPPKHHQ
jgi:mono/diheme cytochrome c family protein